MSASLSTHRAVTALLPAAPSASGVQQSDVAGGSGDDSTPPSGARLTTLIDAVRAVAFPDVCAPPPASVLGSPATIGGGERLLEAIGAILTEQVTRTVLTSRRRSQRSSSPTAVVRGVPWGEGSKPTAGSQSATSSTTGSDVPASSAATAPTAVTLSQYATTPSATASFIRETIERRITQPFLLQRLPKICVLLRLDAEAAFKHDVACSDIGEIILCYPGLLCLCYQRIAHELHDLEAPSVLTRLLTETAHSATGIDIHPGASLGHSVFIDHGTGVVIGGTAIIGNRVCIFQGVTLGAKSFPKDAGGNKIKHLPRHPIVEDDVTIYANATILGRVTIGRGAVIGGNVWVTENVRPKTFVSQQQAAQTDIRLGVDGAGI